MIENTAPYDLNIPVDCSATTTPSLIIKRALALGYRTIALNVQVGLYYYYYIIYYRLW